MGRHRRRRWRRSHRALSLLRVKAALPVRDPGSGDCRLPRALRAARGGQPRPSQRARWGAGRLLPVDAIATSSATGCSSPSRGCWPVSGSPRGRRKPGRPCASESATSSSHGRRSWPGPWNKARSPTGTRACSRARSSASTTASGTGTGRTAPSRCTGPTEFYVARILAMVGVDAGGGTRAAPCGMSATLPPAGRGRALRTRPATRSGSSARSAKTAAS